MWMEGGDDNVRRGRRKVDQAGQLYAIQLELGAGAKGMMRGWLAPPFHLHSKYLLELV